MVMPPKLRSDPNTERYYLKACSGDTVSRSVIQKKADSGDTFCMFAMADILYEGKGIKVDKKKALSYYTKLKKTKNVSSDSELTVFLSTYVDAPAKVPGKVKDSDMVYTRGNKDIDILHDEGSKDSIAKLTSYAKDNDAALKALWDLVRNGSFDSLMAIHSTGRYNTISMGESALDLFPGYFPGFLNGIRMGDRDPLVDHALRHPEKIVSVVKDSEHDQSYSDLIISIARRSDDTHISQWSGIPEMKDLIADLLINGNVHAISYVDVLSLPYDKVLKALDSIRDADVRKKILENIDRDPKYLGGFLESVGSVSNDDMLRYLIGFLQIGSTIAESIATSILDSKGCGDLLRVMMNVDKGLYDDHVDRAFADIGVSSILKMGPGYSMEKALLIRDMVRCKGEDVSCILTEEVTSNGEHAVDALSYLSGFFREEYDLLLSDLSDDVVTNILKGADNELLADLVMAGNNLALEYLENNIDRFGTVYSMLIGRGCKDAIASLGRLASMKNAKAVSLLSMQMGTDHAVPALYALIRCGYRGAGELLENRKDMGDIIDNILDSNDAVLIRMLGVLHQSDAMTVRNGYSVAVNCYRKAIILGDEASEGLLASLASGHMGAREAMVEFSSEGYEFAEEYVCNMGTPGDDVPSVEHLLFSIDSDIKKELSDSDLEQWKEDQRTMMEHCARF